jgi:protein-disulfide isomerase
MMRRESDLHFAVFVGMFMLLVCTPLHASTQSGRAIEETRALAAMAPANITEFVRERFQVPASVKVEAQPVHPSPFPHFYQTAITVDDGKQRRVTDVFLTTDARCFVYGNIFAVNGATDAEIERCVREAAKLPASAEIKVSALAGTAFPDFLKSTVTVKDGTQVRTGEIFVTRDRRTAIVGLVLPFRRDFVQQLIDTKDQPSVGAANARVTIVEYADLECPTCASFQKFLESDFLPRYGSKVRIVFKEFPLPSHPWSLTAANANECAYLLDPSKFCGYRTLIFANQETITATNVRQQMLDLGEQAGLNRLKLSSLLDAQATKGRIDACVREARNLGVAFTPTWFINGRIVIGVPPAPQFYAIVDDALAAANAGQ